VLGADLAAKVAAVLEAAKWEVAIERSCQGIQIDIVGHDPQGQEVIVECKAYTKLVGVRTAHEFSSTVAFLRETKPTLEAWLVTTQGFTPNARDILARDRIEAFTFGELQRRFGIRDGTLTTRIAQWTREAEDARRKQARVFVIMPFADEMLDVFILGIRWAADELGAVSKRADDLEHRGEIIGEIRSAIADYDVIIADTTGANPNVCYEVGYAHALARLTILICRRGEKLPFDLRGINHVMYPNILALRDPLKAKLASLLDAAKRQARSSA
jgi:hypothetical protein